MILTKAKTKAKSKNVFAFCLVFCLRPKRQKRFCFLPWFLPSARRQKRFCLSPWFGLGALFYACAPSPPSFASRLHYRVLFLTFAVALHSFDHRIHTAQGDCRLDKSSTLHAPEALESRTRPTHKPRSLQQRFGPWLFVRRIFKNALAARTGHKSVGNI